MKHGLINKKVTTQDGTDVGTVKDVIVDFEQKDFTLVVSKGRRGEIEIPWNQVASVEETITLAREGRMAGEGAPSEINLNNIGTIKILFYSDCPHYVQTTQDIKEVLIEEGLSANLFSVDLARAPDIEKEMPFAGSPTVLLNGKDIAPAGDQFSGPARGNCRLYDYKGDVYDYPPKELIREALTKKRRQSIEQEGAMGQPRGEAIIGDGEMPAAPEHDLDYHREDEATQQPREETTRRPERRAEETEEGPEEIDIIVYEIETIETEDDEK